MQKLSVELKNAPGNASQVPCSVSGALNREETLSVPYKVLADNGSDENLLQHAGGHKGAVYAYVLNQNGAPLMPCTPAKARHLLASGRAEVIQRTPFTIRLLWSCEVNVQPIILGVDPGYKTTGFSAVPEKKELISGEMKPRTDVSKKIQNRAMYRRNHRSRLWYREPRFDNRKKDEGWLAPSIRHRLQTHIRLVEILRKLLPISKVVVEVANFDQQRMMNPEISGVEYQQGELCGFEVREYLLEKWGRKCAYCKKKNIPLQVEHIIPKSCGGSGRVSNLTISCERCNQEKGNQTAEEFGHPRIQTHAMKPMKAEAFMNNIRWRLVDALKELLPCKHTYGSVTKYRRSKDGLEKSHVNDAFVIASGAGQVRSKPLEVSQTRRNNRCLQKNRKGFRPSIRRQRYKLQPNDLIRKEGKIYRSRGVKSYGKEIRLINSFGNKIESNTKGVELICYGKGILFR